MASFNHSHISLTLEKKKLNSFFFIWKFIQRNRRDVLCQFAGIEYNLRISGFTFKLNFCKYFHVSIQKRFLSYLSEIEKFRLYNWRDFIKLLSCIFQFKLQACKQCLLSRRYNLRLCERWIKGFGMKKKNNVKRWRHLMMFQVNFYADPFKNC